MVYLIYAISTHTLTWSVTDWVLNLKCILVFQLTRSRGAWHIKCSNFKDDDYFNSHAHVERDFAPLYLLVQFLCHFNSHAHVERDNQLCYIHTRRSHFNSHAHVERDILYALKFILTAIISTHTLTWSVTFTIWIIPDLMHISTHTLTWSVTNGLVSAVSGIWFQLTRSRGAWRLRHYRPALRRHFNSHAHVERDFDRGIMNANEIRFQLTRSRGAWHWQLL